LSCDRPPDCETAIDRDNCGQCGHACPATQTCLSFGTSSWACGCAPGYTQCSDGTCSLSCQGDSCGFGELICNGKCVDTYSDANNCGACGHVCPAPAGGSATCSGGCSQPCDSS